MSATRARILHAARIRHDAERTELVAAFLHGEERRHRPRRRALRQMRELLLLGECRLDQRAVLGARAGDELRQAMIALRADDEIDDRRAAHDLGALGLGDAADDGDDRLVAGGRALVLQLADAAEVRIDLLGRLLADMAGVEDDEIGILDGVGFGIALRRERLGHALGIIDVHLAAEGADEDLRPGGRRARRRRPARRTPRRAQSQSLPLSADRPSTRVPVALAGSATTALSDTLCPALKRRRRRLTPTFARARPQRAP